MKEFLLKYHHHGSRPGIHLTNIGLLFVADDIIPLSVGANLNKIFGLFDVIFVNAPP